MGQLRVFVGAFALLLALLAPAIPRAAETDHPPAEDEAEAELPASDRPPAEPETGEPEPAPPSPAPAPSAAPPPASPSSPAPAAPAAPAAAAAAPLLTAAAEPGAAERERDSEGKRKARASATKTVTIKDFEFSPRTVTVQPGDTVSWVNNGPSGHSATAEDDSFDTGVMDEGESGSHRFENAGSFDYICTPHPNMKAKVIVSSAGSTGSGGSGAGTTGSGSDDLTAGGSELADTGLDAILLAAAGAAMITLGYALRRRLRDAS